MRYSIGEEIWDWMVSEKVGCDCGGTGRRTKLVVGITFGLA